MLYRPLRGKSAPLAIAVQRITARLHLQDREEAAEIFHIRLSYAVHVLQAELTPVKCQKALGPYGGRFSVDRS